MEALWNQIESRPYILVPMLIGKALGATVSIALGYWATFQVVVLIGARM